MQHIKVYLITAVIVLIGSLITFLLLQQQTSESALKIGYVDSAKLFDAFELTIESKQEWEDEESAMQASLDSLKMMLSHLDRILGSGELDNTSYELEYSRVYNEYVSKEQRYSELAQEKIQTLDKQILDRLNQYIKDYAKEHSFDMIVGSGSGGLLHIRDQYDVTDQMILFANSKYAGS